MSKQPRTGNMKMRLRGGPAGAALAALWLLAAGAQAAAAQADEVLPRIDQRYAEEAIAEVPDFQRHVVPLFGRLGCNGRACHGSFQGRGGFRLSLFGYDFKADHDALTAADSPRIDVEKPLESLIITKPTSEENHEGGERYAVGSWQYHVLRRWLEAGGKFEESQVQKLVRLEVTPSEIQFTQSGEQVQLQAVAVWEDGSREDVTPLCRFQTNNEQVTKIDEAGRLTSTDPGDTHVVVSYDKAVIPIPVIRPVSELIGERYPPVPAPTKVDELVVQKLRKLGIVPSDLCSDAEFLRRVSLDLAGTLPSAEEVEKFLADSSPDKRAQKVEELLASPGYAAWWTTKLCDFTGNNSDMLNNAGPIRGQASQFWYDWIHERVSKNVPYDKLAEGIVLAKSREPDESYREFCEAMSAIARGDDNRSFSERSCMPYYWARTNFRQPEERVIGFAYSFLGIRIECAQCHKHPFDQWSKQDFDDFKGFFTTVNANRGTPREEKSEYDALLKELGLEGTKLNGNQLRNELTNLMRKGKTVPFPEVSAEAARGAAARRNRNSNNPPAGPTARLLGGEPLQLTQYTDPRQPLMDWLRDKNNPYFARAFVNRVWSTYFNVGIVNPPDDMSLANPPSNRALLDHLTQGFIESNFDMKWVHREILNSRTYQLSWVTNETNQEDQKNFSHAVPRRLPAEVAYDALQLATAASGRATALRADCSQRAIGIPGASARANNNNGPNYALTVFGRSIRESNCDCDRSMEASLLQTVFLQNDRDVIAMLDRPKDGWLAEVGKELARVGGAAQGGESQEAAEKAKQAEAAVKSAERKIDRLKQTGKAEKQVEALQERLAVLQKRYDELQQAAVQAAADEAAAPRPAADPEALVKQAYLRTLSRYPSDEELARSLQFISDSDDTLQGIRGVMWALLNTKEFIVNH